MRRCQNCSRKIVSIVCPCGSINICPQEGPQESFLSSPADIALFGGSAGSGKSHALLMEPLRHVSNKDFGAVIFRRTSPELRAEGALWDASETIYPHVGGKGTEYKLTWEFPSGAGISLAAMEHEKDRLKWHGSQIALLCFDELTTFTERQFFYMLSRNRSTCGVRPYVRCTTNPVSADDPAGGWVRDFVDWWIGEDGYPLPERAGVVRWFCRIENEIVWADSRPECVAKAIEAGVPPASAETMPKTFGFYPAVLSDNKILETIDPGYRANLMAMPRVERLRLLGGNWNVKAEAGELFRSEWFDPDKELGKKLYVELADAKPKFTRMVRYWDKAATKGGRGARTAGCLMALGNDGLFYIVHLVFGRWTPHEREEKMLETAETDRAQYGHVAIWLEKEANSGGKADAAWSISNLAGFEVHAEPPDGNKVARAYGPSAQFEGGNMRMVINPAWNKALIEELLIFPDGRLKDLTDSLSGSFQKLIGRSGPPKLHRPILTSVDTPDGEPEDCEELEPLPVSWQGMFTARDQEDEAEWLDPLLL